MNHEAINAVRIDFTDIRDGYDRRISSMNVIEDNLEEMISIGIQHLNKPVDDSYLVELAMNIYPHNLDDESLEGDDNRTIQTSFLFVIRELNKAISLNELRLPTGEFPYRAFIFSSSRDAITFYPNGEVAGL